MEPRPATRASRMSPFSSTEGFRFRARGRSSHHTGEKLPLRLLEAAESQLAPGSPAASCSNGRAERRVRGAAQKALMPTVVTVPARPAGMPSVRRAVARSSVAHRSSPYMIATTSTAETPAGPRSPCAPGCSRSRSREPRHARLGSVDRLRLEREGHGLGLSIVRTGKRRTDDRSNLSSHRLSCRTSRRLTRGAARRHVVCSHSIAADGNPPGRGGVGATASRRRDECRECSS